MSKSYHSSAFHSLGATVLTQFLALQDYPTVWEREKDEPREIFWELKSCHVASPWQSWASLENPQNHQRKKDEWISFYSLLIPPAGHHDLVHCVWGDHRRPLAYDLIGSWRKNESSDLSFIPSWHNIINYGPFPGNKPCTTTIPKYIIKIYVECILFMFIFLQISIKVYKSKICSHNKRKHVWGS